MGIKRKPVAMEPPCHETKTELFKTIVEKWNQQHRVSSTLLWISSIKITG